MWCARPGKNLSSGCRAERPDAPSHPPLVTLGRIVSRMPFAELPSPRTFVTGGAAALLMIGLTLAGALDTAELGTLNRLFELRGQRSPTAPIIIVTIDE